jgi:hypothetical protein
MEFIFEAVYFHYLKISRKAFSNRLPAVDAEVGKISISRL